MLAQWAEGRLMADDRFKAVAETNGGKTLGYRPSSDPTKPGLYEICFNSGGELHESLKGAWGMREAINAINFYIRVLQRPVKKQAPKKAAPKKINKEK